ncbi:MAG: hypothetical protein IJF67_09625, partial [Clostridia bacterium]|nr:hypothetical protein [Clostridia bacterium]
MIDEQFKLFHVGSLRFSFSITHFRDFVKGNRDLTTMDGYDTIMQERWFHETICCIARRDAYRGGILHIP